jgi:DNA polymerase-3 subunit epsilon
MDRRHKYAIIDTETSSVPDYKLPADDPSQPWLAELAVILIDENLNEAGGSSFFVKPDGWVMEEEASRINGLTTERLMATGIPVATVLDFYEEIVTSGHVIVSYNAQFDCKMMRSALRRAGRPDLFEVTPNICLMRASKAHGIANPDAKRKGAWPKLIHACAHFGIEMGEAHTAMGDARAALEIFRRLHAADALPEAAVHYAKNRPETVE